MTGRAQTWNREFGECLPMFAINNADEPPQHYDLDAVSLLEEAVR